MVKHLNFKIKMFINELLFSSPKNLPEVFLEKRKNYSINLYIPISLKYKGKKILQCAKEFNKI